MLMFFCFVHPVNSPCTLGDVSSLTQGDVRLQSRLLADGSFAGSSTPCILKRDRRRNKTVGGALRFEVFVFFFCLELSLLFSSNGLIREIPPVPQESFYVYSI